MQRFVRRSVGACLGAGPLLALAWATWQRAHAKGRTAPTDRSRIGKRPRFGDWRAAAVSPQALRLQRPGMALD